MTGAETATAGRMTFMRPDRWIDFAIAFALGLWCL
jgi:hypothetical protein